MVCVKVSPILFSVYIDELLLRLSRLGIGCHLGRHSVGALGYADDMAPSPSAMRILLRECEAFASEFEISFNPSKTQLICFSHNRSRSGVFQFIGSPLRSLFTHLGHVLHCKLEDDDDVTIKKYHRKISYRATGHDRCFSRFFICTRK